jgi:hypothetical protein
VFGSVCLIRTVTGLLLACVTAGCAHMQALRQSPNPCYTESGWLDSSSGCTDLEDYPNCYLVCPKTGFRARVEDVAELRGTAQNEQP